MVIKNLEAESLHSQCLLCDSIKVTPKKEIHEIEIRNEMLLLCKSASKSASSRYKLALEENQKAKNDSENERKKQMITNINRRGMEVQSYIAILNKDIDACCQECEEKH